MRELIGKTFEEAAALLSAKGIPYVKKENCDSLTEGDAELVVCVRERANGLEIITSSFKLNI